jgi:hypothetical protein
MSSVQARSAGFVRIDTLRAFAVDVLSAVGHSDHAALIAGVMVAPDLRGDAVGVSSAAD